MNEKLIKFENFVDQNMTPGQRNNNMLKTVIEAKKLDIELFDAKSAILSKFDNSERQQAERDFYRCWNEKTKNVTSYEQYFGEKNKTSSSVENNIIIDKNFENYLKTFEPFPRTQIDERDTSLLKYFFKKNDLFYIVRDRFDICAEARDGLTIFKEEKPLKNYSFFSIGVFKDGYGKRKQDNLKEMRYILLECDYLPMNQQLQFFNSLIDYGFPVKSIIYSGGKSFHCLIKIHPMNDIKAYKEYCEEIYKLLNKLVYNGSKKLVDDANKDGIRYSRSPFGYRADKGKTQEMFYCDMIEADDEKYEFEDVLTMFRKYTQMFIRNEEDTADKIMDHFYGTKYDINYAIDKHKSNIEDIFLNNTNIYVKLKNMELQKIARQDLFDLCSPYFKENVTELILSNKDEKKQYLEAKDFHIPLKGIKFEVRLDKDEKLYNLYEPGFITECLNNKVYEMPSEFEKLLNNISNEREKDWLINHLACHLQLILKNFKRNGSDFVLETVPVFYGKSGTGKNTLLDVIGQAISKEGTRYISIGNIADDFNEFYLAGAVNVNEAANGRSERRASKEALKRFTDKYQRINIKFMQKINILNTAYKSISANESIYGVLDIDKFDRRYQYICGGTQLNGKEHNLLDMELFEKQKRDFISFLLNYECDYNKAMTVFDNEAKIEDKYNSLSNLEKFSLSIKENISEMPFKDFTYEMFVKWYEEKFEKINFCRRDVGKALSPYVERHQTGKDIMINSKYALKIAKGQRYYSICDTISDVE